LEVVCRTVRPGLLDRLFFEKSIGCSGSFCGLSTVTLRTILLAPVDRPPGHLGLSFAGAADCLSLLLLELRFHVSLSWGLFLGLVDLL
jgi:hypothetical protein